MTTAFSPSASRHVFVYGTLRRGEMNDINRLAPAPRFVGAAKMHGTLYDLGAYPGLALGGSSVVVGEVYAITPELEAVLDEIEEVHPQQSGEYEKREVTVQIDDDGGPIDLACLVYEIHPSRIVGRVVIGGGDWVGR